MKSNNSRKFEAAPANEVREDGVAKMQALLSRQLEDLKNKEVETLEDGRAKNREIRKLRESLKKLETPLMNPDQIQKENFNASPSRIAEMESKRDELIESRKEGEKRPWWKKITSWFGSKGSDLELMKQRSEIKNAKKVQSTVAYEIAKKNRVVKAEEPNIPPTPTQESPILDEEDTDTIEIDQNDLNDRY